jgi:hypothetical protein
MTSAKGTGPNSDSKSNRASNMRDRAQKEWRRPGLRKLLIAATTGTKVGANEGNTKKNPGASGNVS